MKKTIALLTLAFGFTAQADIPTGLFTGTDAKGAECTVTVERIYFENNQPHPLNERAEVTFAGATWNLAHPAVISEDNAKVRFNHDQLLQILPTTTGAKTLILKIDHNSEPHGPTELVYINDNYRNAAATEKVVCSGLKQ